MKYIKYLRVAEVFETEADMMIRLNQLGEHGWEMCSGSAEPAAYADCWSLHGLFKREV